MGSRFFRLFYVYFEVALELIAGLYALAWPTAFLRDMAPGFVASGAAAPAALLMAREFGMLNLSFAVIQYSFLRTWQRATVTRLLTAMLPGDVIHVVIAVSFIVENHAFNPANVFNLALSVVTPFLRAYFVFVLVPREGATAAAGSAT